MKVVQDRDGTFLVFHFRPPKPSKADLYEAGITSAISTFQAIAEGQCGEGVDKAARNAAATLEKLVAKDHT